MSPAPLRAAHTPAEHVAFVTAALADYAPHYLDRDAWQAARGAIIVAVAAARPGTVGTAKTLAAVACRALAGQHEWDRRSVPDLAAMLTPREVARLADHWQARGASRGLIRQLRRLAQAVAPPEGQSPPRRPVRALGLAARTLPAAAVLPVSSVTVVAAYQAAGATFHGLTFQGLDLRALAPDLRDLIGSTATVTTDDAGTFTTARPAAQALTAVRTSEVKEASSISSSPSAKPTHPGTTPARRRRRRAAPAAPATPSTLPPLSDDVAEAIAAYRPYRMSDPTWTRIQAATQAALTAYRPRAAGTGVTNIARPIVRFVAWVADQPSRPDPASAVDVTEMTAEGLLDRYLLSIAAKLPAATLATHRSVLRRVLRNLDARPQMPKLAYQPVAAPYTPAEAVRLVRLAYNQPTLTRRRVFLATLALGLGAGLDAGDQRVVTPADIHDVADADGVLATVVTVAGRRARTVVVADEYVPLLRDALALHGSRKADVPLLGARSTHRSVTDTMVTATGDGVKVSVSRLRSTWLVAAMCAPVPLAVLLRTAGLTSARTMVDLLGYCPDPDPATINQLLAALSLDPTAVSEAP
jgi:hypothetical protein